MKKHYMLLVACLVMLSGCGAPDQYDKDSQNEPEEKHTTSEELDTEETEQPDTEDLAEDVEDDVEKVILSDEEIKTIVQDTFFNIITTPENPEVSFGEAVDEALMNHPVPIDGILELGLEPGTALYDSTYDYFNPEIRQYITEDAMVYTLTSRFILLMNPRNDTAFSPTFSQFEVLEKDEDEFTVKHWLDDDYETYETTFELEDGNWKFVRALQTNR